MKGFKIISANKQGSEEGNAEFYQYFEPLFKLLDNYQWVFSFDSFQLPYSWYSKKGPGPEASQLKEFYESYVTETRNFRLCKNDFMQKYAPYVRDDWNEFYCFRNERDHKKILAFLESEEYYDSGRLSKFIRENVDLYFDNVDATFWEVFTSNEAYHIILENLLQDIKGVDVIECDISEIERR